MKNVYTYGAYLHDGSLIEIKVIAEHQEDAFDVVRDMCSQSNYVDMEQGIFLNDEYEYKE